MQYKKMIKEIRILTKDQNKQVYISLDGETNHLLRGVGLLDRFNNGKEVVIILEAEKTYK